MVPNSDSDQHADDTVFGQRDWLQITLSSIGDGVITADRDGRVNYLNPVAEKLTGWTLADAVGVEVEQVFASSTRRRGSRSRSRPGRSSSEG
ncbi:PAS domain-containing protein [Singulisphaera sp. Ch08]|uniref:PAS domain-containing protein n=1 Tax=Singulisphaera sp. Ch08 TaxID=3120278 RepID=A0AAU7CLZ9_9BACT